MTNEYNYDIKSLAPVATGGTVTTSGGYRIHTFTSSGTFVPIKSMNVECLIVAGGGGGGDDIGGGGGGGKVIYKSSSPVVNQAYPIIVGSGGMHVTNGGTSSFSSYSATGGTAGLRASYAGEIPHGGNSSKSIDGLTTNYNGGTGYSTGGGTRLGGGGAGANANGNAYSGTTAGNGGAGLLSNISGSNVYYAGGGGGGVEQSAWTPGIGNDGGGNGGRSNNTPNGYNGVANTGGGGGGAGGLASVVSGIGGTGGSGIVIVRYLSSEDVTATNMTITPSENPCRTGVCTITVNVTWTNNNGTLPSSFIPAIIVSSGTATTYSSQTLVAGDSVTLPFTVLGMTVGTCTICPNPN